MENSGFDISRYRATRINHGGRVDFRVEVSMKATDVDAAVGFSDRTRRGENIERHANSSLDIFKYQEHLFSRIRSDLAASRRPA